MDSNSASTAVAAFPPVGQELFSDVAATDFLHFSTSGKSYAATLENLYRTTGKRSAITCRIRLLDGVNVMWMEHDFHFIGGSLGCSEGERLVRGLMKAAELHIPAVIVCRSGGARMHEGTLAMLQIAKVSAAVQYFKDHSGKPYISVCCEPTYGGASASYGMEGDVRIGVRSARVGFAGESVILNTVYGMDKAQFEKEKPVGFQTAPEALRHGQLDLVVDSEAEIDATVSRILAVLLAPRSAPADSLPVPQRGADECTLFGAQEHNYALSRSHARVQAQDLMSEIFEKYTELSGDGSVGADRCIRGGIALFRGRPVVVVATCKGHDAASAAEANFGMSSPAGYRTAKKLFRLAEHFGVPVVTLVDTPGAYPSFSSEMDGQAEAIATNLLTLSSLRVPVCALLVGEGGSGGAIALALANRIAMMEQSYFAPITPEGAASILCRYKSEEEKAARFEKDCQEMARSQKIYPSDMLELGVIEEIIPERVGEPRARAAARVAQWLERTLTELCRKTPDELVAQRFEKFRNIGQFFEGPAPALEPLDPSAATNAAPARRPAAAKPENHPAAPEAEKPEEVKPERGNVVAPLTGIVHSYEADIGGCVKEGDVVAVVFGMKMQIPVYADCDGVITKLGPSEGTKAQRGDLLVLISPVAQYAMPRRTRPCP